MKIIAMRMLKRSSSMLEQMRNMRLRWFGHVKRRCESTQIRRCERLVVERVKRG